MNPGTLVSKPVRAFLEHPQKRPVWSEQRGGLGARREEMLPVSEQWDCSRPLPTPGSQERSGVISSQGASAGRDGGSRGEQAGVTENSSLGTHRPRFSSGPCLQLAV